jgi:uncharacterized protein (DUF1330 family)
VTWRSPLGRTGFEGFRNPTFKYETLLSKKRGLDGGDPITEAIVTRYQGAAPAPRVVVIQFESLDNLQALYDSAPYKNAVAVGDEYATQRIFGAEGVSP